mmetsp:Transcript_2121/g.6651  ORF Transcript_2121/g.6651 Transcript_2121/m.6651 type:complete len:338 (+) Transcript_2121:595-1608(+)
MQPMSIEGTNARDAAQLVKGGGQALSGIIALSGLGTVRSTGGRGGRAAPRSRRGGSGEVNRQHTESERRARPAATPRAIPTPRGRRVMLHVSQSARAGATSGARVGPVDRASVPHGIKTERARRRPRPSLGRHNQQLRAMPAAQLAGEAGPKRTTAAVPCESSLEAGPPRPRWLRSHSAVPLVAGAPLAARLGQAAPLAHAAPPASQSPESSHDAVATPPLSAEAQPRQDVRARDALAPKESRQLASLPPSLRRAEQLRAACRGGARRARSAPRSVEARLQRCPVRRRPRSRPDGPGPTCSGRQAPAEGCAAQGRPSRAQCSGPQPAPALAWRLRAE